MPEDLINQTLNRYLILSLLGEGGMGAVYKAQDTALNREVAVKVLHSHFARQPNFRERFLQEARTAARLDHPGIVKVFDFGEALSQLYIVMELVPGENLQDALNKEWAQGKTFPLNDSTRLIRQIALTLDYLHKQEILHRDIKPANILLKPEPVEGLPYRPVLTDLGLARLLDSPRLTQDGSSMGTPAYMSPEQASGQTTDARSDVYSLGILLYELVVGRLPFPIHTITEAIRYHTQEPPPAPRSLRPDLSENLEQVILHAIEKDPSSRFQDAASLAQALEQAIRSLSRPPSVPIKPAAKSPGPIPSPRQLRSNQGVPAPVSERRSPGPSKSDGIQVTAKNKPPQFIPIKPRIKDMVEMSIGRDEDSDIHLDSPGVSRHHAKLTFDGNEYYLTDLNSTNRTFLGDAELLPGVAERWSPEKAAQIGIFMLQLVLAGQKAQPIKLPSKPPSERQGFRRTNGSLIAIDPGNTQMESRIWVDLEEEAITVEAGNKVVLNMNLLNQGGFVDQFHVNIKGVDESWVSIQPPVANLMPGDQSTVVITFQPPRQPTSQAKKYDLTIRVIPEKPPKKISTASATLTVLPYFQSRSDMHPTKIKGRKVTRVTIQNMGNSPENFVLLPLDKGDELVFRPPQAQVNIPEGQQSAVEFRARPRAPRLIGSKQSLPFTIQVTSSQGNAQPHMGEYVSTALIPPWFPISIVALCALLALTIPKLIATFRPSPTPTLTSVPVALEMTVVPDTPEPTVSPSPFLTETPILALTQTTAALCLGAPESTFKVGDMAKVSQKIQGNSLFVHKTPIIIGDERICALPPKTEFQIIAGPQCAPCQSECIKGLTEPINVWMWKIRISEEDRANADVLFGCGTREGWVVEADPENIYIHIIDK
jgi:serine/threonine protein kinase